MAQILSANRSSVLINGKTMEGLQEITFQTVKPQMDISAIGTDERIGVVYGMSVVHGTMRVRSGNDELEALFLTKAPFQVFASLKHVVAADETIKEITLDECFLTGKSFGLATGGVVDVTYAFTATRER